MSHPPPEVCPVCGADVPPDALACPDCGADDETGWNEETTATDGLNLPDEEFDYDDFVRREFGEDPAPAGSRRRALWVGVGVVVLGALVLWWATGL